MPGHASDAIDAADGGVIEDEPEPLPGASQPAGLSLDVLIDDKGWPTFAADHEYTSRIARTIASVIAVSADQVAAISFANDAAVRDLNARYRSADKPTNVLSFPAPPASADFAGPRPLGDIILARETIEREAGEQGITLADHTTHLIVHGCLHLFGYDHGDARAADEMETLEIDILGLLGIANPYTEELNDRGALMGTSPAVT